MAAMAVTAVGCTDLIGLKDVPLPLEGGASNSNMSPDDPGGVATGHCGTLPETSASCASCVDASCCDEATACAADPACREASSCLAACKDDTCRADCAVFATIPPTLMALRACRVGHCAAPCGSGCGEFASGVTGCQACQDSACCSQGAACALSGSCQTIELCRRNCLGAASCPDDCSASNPEGAAVDSDLLSCTAQCASSCQSGQEWACLDRPVTWPFPMGNRTLIFSATFTDLAEQPYVGSSVKACAKLDVDCTAPLAQTVTDATGTLTISLPPGLMGFDGYLDLTGGMVPTDGHHLYPTIWYPRPFVTTDGWHGKARVISVEELARLSGAISAQIDPTRGHLVTVGRDCVFNRAAGISFTAPAADAKSVSYYFVTGVPATTVTQTDATGVGGYLNLSPGLVVVAASSMAASGKPMGAISVIIRAGSFTVTNFPPLPPR